MQPSAPGCKDAICRAIHNCWFVIVADSMQHTYKEVIPMPLYQQLLFGCANPRFGLAIRKTSARVCTTQEQLLIERHRYHLLVSVWFIESVTVTSPQI